MKNQAPPILMLFGTFHFANPARDLVKSGVNDVLSAASQSYLAELTQRISKYNPSHILLEYDPTEDQSVNNRYGKYRNDEYQLSRDEIEQLGFRIAKSLGLNRVHSFDERNIPWLSEKLFEQLNKSPEIEKQFNEAIFQLTEEEKSAQSTLSLRELLKRYNSAEMDRRNKSLYLMTNAIGVDENFVGADASASWWHRNFRMFARIQKFAQPGARLLVIGGQGHIAVIRDLVKLDPNLISEEIDFYL